MHKEKKVLSLHRQIKHTYLILTPSSRPVVKLHGFFHLIVSRGTFAKQGSHINNQHFIYLIVI